MSKFQMILLVVLSAVSMQAVAATAFYNGQMQYVTTVTGKSAIKCGYTYNGQTFYRLFNIGQMCPTKLK